MSEKIFDKQQKTDVQVLEDALSAGNALRLEANQPYHAALLPPGSNENAKWMGELVGSVAANAAMARIQYGTHWGTLSSRSLITGMAIAAGVELIPEIPGAISETINRWRSGTGLDEKDGEAVLSRVGTVLMHGVGNAVAGYAAGRITLNKWFPDDFYQGIPSLRRDGTLPEGVHFANWQDIVEKFGTNEHRINILNSGLFEALHDLKNAGSQRAWIGGSLVTKKELPNDFDIAYKSFDNQLKKLPILWDRGLQKEAYNGEMWPDDMNYFRKARSGKQIGVIEVDLDTLPERKGVSPAVAVLERHQRVVENEIVEGNQKSWSPALDQNRLDRVAENAGAVLDRTKRTPQDVVPVADITPYIHRRVLRADIPAEALVPARKFWQIKAPAAGVATASH
jgi:hypothetical protein